MNKATEFEIMRSLHTLWVGGFMGKEQVGELLIQSTTLELLFLNESKIVAESLDRKTKLVIGN